MYYAPLGASWLQQDVSLTSRTRNKSFAMRHPGRDLTEEMREYSEASVIAVNGDRDHPRKLKIREEAAPF